MGRHAGAGVEAGLICHCARCRRPVKPENVVTVDGRGYGPACALKVKPLDLLTPRERSRRLFTGGQRRRRRDERQLQLEVTP